MKNTFRYLPQTFSLIRMAAPVETIVWFLLLIVQGLLPVASAYAIRMLVDSLVTSLQHRNAEWRGTVLLLFALILLQLLSELFRASSGWIRATMAEKVHDHIVSIVHRKSVEVDLSFYDQPEFFDHLYRARTDASHRPIRLLESSGSFFQNTLTLIAMCIVLIPFGFWIPLALLLSTIPALAVVIRHAFRYHRWVLDSASEQRRLWYLDWMITAPATAPEVRLFKLGAYVSDQYQQIRKRLREKKSELLKSESIGQLAASLAGYSISGVTFFWIVRRTWLGLHTMGDLVFFYQAFSQGQRLMRSLLDNVREVYINSLFLENFYEFLNVKSGVMDSVNPEPMPKRLKTGIEFKRVTFHYPDGQRPALSNLELFIPAGKFVAIVGSNGAGKTTLIKLLCRFYDPAEGQILVDGTDLRELDQDELRKRITVLFQQPVHYSATVSENIGIGDLANSSDSFAVRTAARNAEAEGLIDSLPNRYETLLGKWFVAGTELSPGEWQRIALARAFFRNAPIVLLDEPTSAMDSWTESAWLETFRKLVVDKTAILITHRFTTAMQADTIFVMEQGRIVESGTHDELLQMAGRYAQSWQKQHRIRDRGMAM